jgi:hypothetical protein
MFPFTIYLLYLAELTFAKAPRSNLHQAHVSEPDPEMDYSPPSSPSQASGHGASRAGRLHGEDNNRRAFPHPAPRAQPSGLRFNQGAPAANAFGFQAQQPRHPYDGGPVRPHPTVPVNLTDGPPARANGYAPTGISPPPLYTSSMPPSFSSVASDLRPRSAPYSRGPPHAPPSGPRYQGEPMDGVRTPPFGIAPPVGPTQQGPPHMAPSGPRMPGFPSQAGDASYGQPQQGMPGLQSLEDLPTFLAQALRPLEDLDSMFGGRGPAPRTPASASVGSNVNSSGCDSSHGCVNSRDCVNCHGCVNSRRLVNCHGCVNCTDCRDCRNCVNCTNCSGLDGQTGASNQHA